MLKAIKPIILLSCLGTTLFGQEPTVGLISFDGEVSEGYTLFSPEKNEMVYLIDNCGEKINEWTFSENPDRTSYLLDDGTLLQVGEDSLEIRDWDNNLLWSYPTHINGISTHHDIEPLPNGNILCIARDEYTIGEIIAAGRNPTNAYEPFVLDRIVELEPIGTSHANVVWEWKFYDHLVQEYDQNALNYGVVSQHPELVNVNYTMMNSPNWNHINAIDYNENLDQIIMSSRQFSEIYIIDHSTSTAEAAGHSGGNSGKGGDILWRWGNPEAYGSSNERKLFRQHDVKWVENGYQDEGMISVFNNGGAETNFESSIHLIEPVLANGDYAMSNGTFLPEDYHWTWSGQILGSTLYEEKKSGVQILPNGNALICESSIGRFSEISSSGNLVWSYINPTGFQVYDQFQLMPLQENSIFRAQKYPSDFAGFSGKDLTPQGIIENQNNISEACFVVTGINPKETIQAVAIHNPVMDGIVRLNKEVDAKKVIVTDLTGKVVFDCQPFKGHQLNLNLGQGLYVIQFQFADPKKDQAIKLFSQ